MTLIKGLKDVTGAMMTSQHRADSPTCLPKQLSFDPKMIQLNLKPKIIPKCVLAFKEKTLKFCKSNKKLQKDNSIHLSAFADEVFLQK